MDGVEKIWIMYLIGCHDRYIDRCIDRYIDHYSIDPRPTRDRHRPRVDRCFYRASTDVGRGIDRDHIGSLSVNYRRDIG